MWLDVAVEVDDNVCDKHADAVIDDLQKVPKLAEVTEIPDVQVNVAYYGQGIFADLYVSIVFRIFFRLKSSVCHVIEIYVTAAITEDVAINIHNLTSIFIFCC